MGIKLGDAILYITGDDSKLGQTLNGATQKAKGWATNLGGTVATLAGGAILAGAVATTGAIVGMGAAAWTVSNQFQDATNAIINGTGASGEALAGMEQNVKNLAGTSHGLNRNFGEIGATLAEVNTRTGATGKTLEDFTGKILDYSRLTGGDAVNQTQLVTRVMGDWGVQMEDSSALLDKLYGAGQAFGINVDSLSQKVVQFGAPLRQMGFSLDESIALFGKWEKEGVNAELAIGSLRIAAGKFAKENIPLKDGLRDTMEAIKNATSESEGLSIAMETFGARAGPDMAAAIREGRFELDEAVAALKNTDGALEDASNRTLKFSDKLKILKNRAMIAIMPIGDKLLELANSAMPYVEKAFSWFEKKLPEIMNVASSVIDDLFSAFAWLFKGEGANVDWLGDIVGEIMNLLGMKVSGKEGPYNAIVNGVYKVWDILVLARDYIVNVVIPSLQQFAKWLINEGIPAFLDFVTPIIQQVIPGLQLLGEIIMNIATTAWPYLSAAIQWAMDNMDLILPILGAVGVAILAITSPITLVIGAIVLLATAWANNWGGIQEKTQAVLDFIMPYIQTAMAVIQDIVSKVLGYISAWWEKHGDNLIAVAKFVWDFILKSISDKLQAIWTVIKVVLALIQKFWDDWGQTILLMVQLVWDNITTVIKAAMDMIGYIIDAAAALIRGDWDAFGEALQNIWSTAWDAIQTILSNAKTALVAVIANLIKIIKEDYWQPFIDNLKETWQGLWDGLVQGIIDAKDDVIEKIGQIIEAIKDAFTGMDLLQVGKDLMGNIIDGMTLGLGELADLADDFVDSLVDQIKWSLGIFSPSKVFQGIGFNSMLGLAKGMVDNMNLPLDAFKNVVAGLQGGGGLIGSSQTSISSVVNNYLNVSSSAPKGTLLGEYQALDAFNTT